MSAKAKGGQVAAAHISVERVAQEKELSSQRQADSSQSHRLIFLLLSDDAELASLVASVARQPWQVDQRLSISKGADFWERGSPQLVLLDDSVVPESERGWLLRQIRKYSTQTGLIYIASVHDEENEKRARAGGAHYYTAKPIHGGHLTGVLSSFLKLYGQRQGLARTASSSAGRCRKS